VIMVKYIWALMILGILLTSCKKSDADFRSELEDIPNMETFLTKIESGVSLIFFHATWCSKCAAQRPAVEGLLLESSLNTVFIGEVNYERVSDVVSTFGVQGFPTIVLFKDGEEAQRFTGTGHSKEKLQEALIDLL